MYKIQYCLAVDFPKLINQFNETTIKILKSILQISKRDSKIYMENKNT